MEIPGPESNQEPYYHKVTAAGTLLMHRITLHPCSTLYTLTEKITFLGKKKKSKTFLQMHIKLGQCEEKRGSDHTSKLWPPGWFHLLWGPFCFSLFCSHFPFFTLSLHLLSSAHFSDSCEHQNITSYAFWRAAFQNNTQQSFILVTKRTFPWRLPLQNKKKKQKNPPMLSAKLHLVPSHWEYS